MASRRPKTVLYRRKRENKTSYPKRIKFLLSGKKRLVVRLTNNKIITQLVEFAAQGDKVLVSVDSSALKKLGWKYSCKNVPAAYLTGLLAGKKALEKGHKEAILDTGSGSPLHKGKIYAFLKGVLDAGLKVPHGSEEVFPTEERIKGEHIKQYAEKIKTDKEAYQKMFAQYLKDNAEPEKIVDVFENVKEKIAS